MTVQVVFAIAGVIALFLAVWGGGVKVKEIEVPTSPVNARIIVGIIGLVFIGISLWPSSPGLNDSPQALPEIPTSALPTATSVATIEATMTVIPSPSPTITSAPTLTVEEQSAELFRLASQSWKLEVLDTFEANNYDWAIGERLTGDENDVANVSINGKYYIDIQTGDGGGWFLYSDIQTPGIFYLAADLRRTSDEPGCSMSLGWGTPNGDYLFHVYDNEKNYYLEVSETGDWVDVIPRTTSNQIRPQEVNKLAVINDGTYLWLYINEHFVDRTEAEYETKGDLGFYVSVCQENAQVTFQFDNLELRRPPE